MTREHLKKHEKEVRRKNNLCSRESVNLDWNCMALNLRSNLMTKFEWETNKKQMECKEEEWRFAGTLLAKLPY